MDKELLAKVGEFVESNRDTIISELFEMCRIDSVRGEPEEGAPYGRKCMFALEKVAEIAGRYGLSTEINRKYGYSVTSLGEGDKSVAVIGHTDVVPAGDAWEKTQAFEPKLIDGVLYGRGVRDDKGGVLAGIYVQRAIKELKIPVKSRILTVAGSAEETGMQDIRDFYKNYKPQPTVSMVADSDFSVCHCEKDVFRCEVLSKKPFELVKDFSAGIANNAVPGTANAIFPDKEGLFAALSAICEKDDDLSICRENGEIKVHAKGISTHGAYPKGSKSALHTLANALYTCSAICENDRKILEAAAVSTEGYYGEGLGIAKEDEQTGKLVCTCGLARTENGKLHLSFNSRLCISADEAYAKRGFERFFGEKYDFEILLTDYGKGYYKDANDPLILCMLNSYREVSGIQDAKPYVMPGGTYAKYLENAYAFGYSTLRSVGDVPQGHGKAHQPDESMRLCCLLEAFKTYIMAAVELDKAINE